MIKTKRRWRKHTCWLSDDGRFLIVASGVRTHPYVLSEHRPNIDSEGFRSLRGAKLGANNKEQ